MLTQDHIDLDQTTALDGHEGAFAAHGVTVAIPAVLGAMHDMAAFDQLLTSLGAISSGQDDTDRRLGVFN